MQMNSVQWRHYIQFIYTRNFHAHPTIPGHGFDQRVVGGRFEEDTVGKVLQKVQVFQGRRLLGPFVLGGAPFVRRAFQVEL